MRVARDAAPDAMPDALDKSATCAPTFGNALTNAHGRLDGTVVAVVPPNDQACASPNMTHLVVQLSMGGAAYRMVVDVISDTGANDNYSSRSIIRSSAIRGPTAGTPRSRSTIPRSSACTRRSSCRPNRR